METFWKLFKWGEHIHFATYLAGLVGSAVTFVWAAWEGRSALDTWVLALAVAALVMIIVQLALKIFELVRPAVATSSDQTNQWRASDTLRDFQEGKWEPKLSPSWPHPKSVDGPATKSTPYYTRDDIDQMLAATRRISILVNQSAVEARDAAQEILNQWAHIIDKMGKAAFAEQMRKADEKVKAVENEGWAIVRDYQHYHDVIGPVLSAMHFGSEYFIVSDRFKDAVALLPGETGHGTTLNLLMPYRDRFATQVKELQDWMSGTFTRLEAITSHLRTMPADNRQAATQPWKPVHVAVEHVAERIGDSESSWPLARVALRQAAYDKRVRIRGRKQLADLLPKTTFAKIHTDIDSDYWAVSDLSPLATNSALDEFTHTLPQSAYAWGKRGLEEPMQCTQLLVNWDDVTREWP